MNIEYIIDQECKGLRVDTAISKTNRQYSRSLIQKWIKSGRVLIDGNVIRQSETVQGGESVIIFPESIITQDDIIPKKILINLVKEDKDFLVINKAVGQVAHPAAGHYEDTLANGLVYHYPELHCLPRAGLIHRLDKDTSGLLLVARNIESYTRLVKLMQERKISRKYLAYVYGNLSNEGTIDYPISRHKTNRKKMAVNNDGKKAITNYKVEKNYENYFTKIKLSLVTGRTHQIRVHCEYIGHPLLGEELYASKKRYRNIIPKEIIKKICFLNRQALHAYELSFINPLDNNLVCETCIEPSDLKNIEKILNAI